MSAEELLDTSGDLFGLRHPADPDLALGELALGRADQLGATVLQQRDVRLRRGVPPHADVHRRREEERTVVCQRRLGEEVVGEPVRQPGERVRGRGRDDEQLSALEVGIGIVAWRLPREGEERVRGDEPLGARRDDRVDVVARPHQQPQERARLVGRDPPGDSEQDAGHPVPLDGWVLVLDLPAGDLFHRHRQVVLRAGLDQRRRGFLEADALPELVVVVVDLPRALGCDDHEGVP